MATTVAKALHDAGPVLVALLGACCSHQLLAQEPDAPLPEPAQPSAVEVSRELDQRLRDIERLQSELGLYHPALIESYDELARFYEDNGEPQQALEMHRQALQLARINNGLYSELQLPIIDRVIAGSLALNDWQQADDMHQLRYHLTNRLYEPADPRFAEAVATLGEWKLRAMRENLLSDGSRGLGNEAENLSRIYRDSIARIQASPDFDETSLLPLYKGKSQADLEIARLLSETPYQFFEGTVSRFVYEQVCRNVRTPQGQVVRQCSQVRRENPRYRQSQRDNKRMMVYRSVRDVETSIRSLNDIIARSSDLPTGQREQILSQIRELEAEFQRIERNSRRSMLF